MLAYSSKLAITSSSFAGETQADVQASNTNPSQKSGLAEVASSGMFMALPGINIYTWVVSQEMCLKLIQGIYVST